MGMIVARAILDRLLDPGRNDTFVQFTTVRKTRSMMTNVAQATASGLEDVIGSYKRSRVWISSVPTHLFWFTIFMSGIHKRVGDVTKQDKAVTIDVILEVDRIRRKSKGTCIPTLRKQSPSPRWECGSLSVSAWDFVVKRCL
jgi:hypothetical protein